MTLQANLAPGSEAGSAFQYQVPAPAHALASTVAASGNTASPVLPSGGYQKLSVGATSTQTGQIQIQRYLDVAGTIAQGAAITASLTAGVAAVANVNDGLPFQSFKVTITNTGASAATLTNVIVLQQSA